jgi:hypothetical protein
MERWRPGYAEDMVWKMIQNAPASQASKFAGVCAPGAKEVRRRLHGKPEPRLEGMDTLQGCGLKRSKDTQDGPEDVMDH